MQTIVPTHEYTEHMFRRQPVRADFESHVERAYSASHSTIGFVAEAGIRTIFF